jgi:hypothetical protein
MWFVQLIFDRITSSAAKIASGSELTRHVS